MGFEFGSVAHLDVKITLISFIVVKGAQTNQDRASLSTKGQDWFHAVDYSHILLGRRAAQGSVRTSEKSSLSRILFSLDYFLPSSLRERVEFRLTQVLFRDTYSEQDFQYAAYLSGCFDRYALKTVHRSGIILLVLGLLAALNYVRVLLRVEFSGCFSPSAVPLGNATEPTTHALSATLLQSAAAGGEGASLSYEAKGCR